MKINLNWNDVKENLFIGIRPVTEDAVATAKYLDLEVYVYIRFEIGTVKVTHQILDLWGHTFGEVFMVAEQNTAKGTEIQSMLDMMRGFGVEVPADAPDQTVITNKEGSYGAGALFCPWVLRRAAERCGVDRVIILPSSIHELIVIPDDGEYKEKDKMVREINQSQVAPEERLADHIYVYDAVTNAVEIR